MDYYMNQGIQKKEAMKMVAKDRGSQKRHLPGVVIKVMMDKKPELQ